MAKKVVKKKKIQEKVKKTIKEFEKGKLHQGSEKGPIVKNKDQAIAIGYSEGRKAIKKKKKK